MRIKIINFQVKEIHTLVEDLNVFQFAWRSVFGLMINVQYHFDCVLKINEDYITSGRQLERGDRIQLPNNIQLLVWSVDRFGMIRAKTLNWVDEDLRGYHPIETWLVYEKQHGHISDFR